MPTRYSTCPWKAGSLIATTDPTAPPANACVPECALFLQQFDAKGRLVNGACALVVLAVNVAGVNQKLELVAAGRREPPPPTDPEKVS